MTIITSRNICAFAAALILIFSGAAIEAQSRASDAAIAKAKATLVSRIERGMPAQPFASWFRSLVGKRMVITWETTDCGEQTGTPEDRGRDFPMCVEANAASRTADFHISVSIQYGTFKRGVTRMKPVVRYIFAGDASGENGKSFGGLKELGEVGDQVARNAEFFDPNIGIFGLEVNVSAPVGFENFESMWVETAEQRIVRNRVVRVPLKKRGEITFGPTAFALRNIFFDGKRWTYDTESIDGVSYRFAGKFGKLVLDTNGVPNSTNILTGHLTRLVNGVKVAETDLTLSFYMQGE